MKLFILTCICFIFTQLDCIKEPHQLDLKIDGDDRLDGVAAKDTCDGSAHVSGDTATACETVTNVP